MAKDDQIIDELQKIRQLLEPKPAPPAPPPPKGLWAEFKAFIAKGGILGIAIAFILGTYIGKVISALVQDLIMPIAGAFVPGGDWRTAVFTLDIGNGMNFAIGDFIGVIIDFLIVAFVIFLIVRYAKKMGVQ